MITLILLIFFYWTKNLTVFYKEKPVNKIETKYYYNTVKKGVILFSKQEELNVKSFGAKGDGVTDDYSAINNALLEAQQEHKSLFFPSGNYIVNTNKSGASFRIYGGANLKLRGEEGTIITSTITPDKAGYSLFIFYYAFTGLKIDHISFVSTHKLTSEFTNAILTMKGKGKVGNISPEITNCIFNGFSTSLHFNGTKDLIIHNCRFYAPLGHDNAQTNLQPAVDIWFTDNLDGINEDAVVDNNYAEGYSGIDINSTTTKKAMDGFVFGNPSGIKITNNVLNNFSEESIMVQPNLNTSNYTIINYNKIQYKLHKGNGLYGIRAENNNMEISNNIIANECTGILCFGSAVNLKFNNWKISSNYITLHTGDNYGIYVQGNNTNMAQNILIENNEISAKQVTLKHDLSLIFIADAEDVTISKNRLFTKEVNANRYKLNSILLMNKTSGIHTLNNNQIINY